MATTCRQANATYELSSVLSLVDFDLVDEPDVDDTHHQLGILNLVECFENNLLGDFAHAYILRVNS